MFEPRLAGFLLMLAFWTLPRAHGASSAAGGQSSAPARAAAAPAALEELLEPIRERHKLPALAGVILNRGDVVAAGAVGVRRLGDAARVTIDDRFHIGSCTKAMTATLAAMLVEQGRLRWDSTLSEVFPERAAAMHADYRSVTLEQLLAHRAGMPEDLSADGLWERLWEHEGPPTEARLLLLDGVTRRPPLYPPGTRHVYSNASYAVAGAMAERVTGASWEDLMRERLFKPLGMTTAGFGAPGTQAALDQPRGHQGTAGSYSPIEPGPGSDNPPAIGPAGTVHCSLPDWARFVALHLARGRARGDGPGGGAALLSAASLERLHAPPAGQDYALGWIATHRPWGGNVLTHGGSNTMWFAVVWAAPEKDFAVLVATNAGDAAAMRAADEAAWAMIQRHLNPPERRGPP